MVIIRQVEGAELYDHKLGQSEPETVFLYLECFSGKVWAESGSYHTWSMDVHHQRTLRWSIPPLLPDVANEFIQSLTPHFKVICDHYVESWDGSNHIGQHSHLSADALSAINNEFQKLWWDAEHYSIHWMDASDYLHPMEDEIVHRFLDCGDSIETLAADLDGNGLCEDTPLLHGLRGYLERLESMAKSEITRET